MRFVPRSKDFFSKRSKVFGFYEDWREHEEARERDSIRLVFSR